MKKIYKGDYFLEMGIESIEVYEQDVFSKETGKLLGRYLITYSDEFTYWGQYEEKWLEELLKDHEQYLVDEIPPNELIIHPVETLQELVEMHGVDSLELKEIIEKKKDITEEIAIFIADTFKKPYLKQFFLNLQKKYDEELITYEKLLEGEGL